MSRIILPFARRSWQTRLLSKWIFKLPVTRASDSPTRRVWPRLLICLPEHIHNGRTRGARMLTAKLFTGLAILLVVFAFASSRRSLDMYFHATYFVLSFSHLLFFVNLWQPCQFLGGQSCEFCGPLDLSRSTEYSPDSRFVARRRISDGVETFEILGRETEIFKRENSYNPYILEIKIGISNLFVPADNFAFAAPSMILHYIHGHGYDPPSSFWDTAMASSRLSFEAYKEALIRNGLLEAIKPKRKRPR
jgi:hypothetical protein